MNKCQGINEMEIWNSQQMSFIIWKVSCLFSVWVLQRRISVAMSLWNCQLYVFQYGVKGLEAEHSLQDFGGFGQVVRSMSCQVTCYSPSSVSCGQVMHEYVTVFSECAPQTKLWQFEHRLVTLFSLLLWQAMHRPRFLLSGVLVTCGCIPMLIIARATLGLPNICEVSARLWITGMTSCSPSLRRNSRRLSCFLVTSSCHWWFRIGSRTDALRQAASTIK